MFANATAPDGGPQELLLAQSFAKNMGLYGERVGALSFICRCGRCVLLQLWGGLWRTACCLVVMGMFWGRAVSAWAERGARLCPVGHRQRCGCSVPPPHATACACTFARLNQGPLQAAHGALAGSGILPQCCVGGVGARQALHVSLVIQTTSAAPPCFACLGAGARTWRQRWMVSCGS